MEPPNPFHTITGSGFQHFQRAQRGFLARLEKNPHAPLQFFLFFLKKQGRADSCRDMEIMPAGMHLPRTKGTVGKPGLLFYRKRINITAQSLHRPFLFPPDYGCKACLQPVWKDFYPFPFQQLPDFGRRIIFFIRKLRVLMEPVKSFLQFLFQHSLPLFPPVRHSFDTHEERY